MPPATLALVGPPCTLRCKSYRWKLPISLVGTPSHVFDMLNWRCPSPKYIKMCALDKADEMLSCGFKDQIHDVFQKLNNNTQRGLLSAALPSNVLEVTRKFMRDPIQILVKKMN